MKTLICVGGNMATKFRTIAISILTIFILFTPMATNAENSESIYIDGGNIDSDFTVSNGQTVFISNSVTIADEVSIHIENGGILNLSGTIKGTSLGSTILPYGINASIMIPNVVESGTKVVKITINLESEEEYGPGLFWEDNWENITNESSHTILTSFSEGDSSLEIKMLGNNIYGTKITSISLMIDNSEILSQSPWYYIQEGLKPYNSRNWNLINDGTLNLLDSEIIGANISGGGTFNAINSHYNLSSPILLTSESIFNIDGGGMDGSETDEYIEGPWGVEIIWNNAINTGDGDRWIKTLDCQKIILPTPESFVIVKNIQYMNGGVFVDRQGFANENSEFEFAGMCGTGWRMVEIVDSEGNSWMEDAYIESAWWNSPWGNFSASNIPLGFEPIVEIEFNIPNVNVNSITLNKNEAVVDEPIEVTITLENSGNASAMVPIECTLSDGSDADVSPFGQTVIIAAGQTGEVLIDWRHNSEGNESLTCQPLKPSGFENSDILGGGAVTSEIVNWNALMQSSDSTASSMIVLVFLFAGIAALVIYLKKTNIESEYSKEEKSDPVKK